MKHFILLLLFTFESIISFSQQTKDFFNDDNEETDEVNAYYYKVGVKVRNSSGSTYYIDTVKTYYVKTNSLRSVSNYVEGFQEGEYKEYFENGNLKETGVDEKSRDIGKWKSFYPDGKPQRIVEYPKKPGDISKFSELDFKILDYWDSTGAQTVINGNGHYKHYFFDKDVLRKEEGEVVNGLHDYAWKGYSNGILSYSENFSQGSFLDGISYHEGNIFRYNVLSEPAEYPGGMKKLYKFLNSNIGYPIIARKLGIVGRVFVQFVINTDGSLSDVKIIKGVHESIDEESLRLVRSMPKWVPGKSRGREVKSKFVLPLTYNLQR
ncbi:MAG TPA: TonB family protein [Cyclobacteriaceae bacterium]|jgi:TonB family protein|nr:TonB family protein [Cyclobacteriaceae bacterium]